MKHNRHPFALRNVYENLALILFMFLLLVVSFFQEAKAQDFSQFTGDPYFPAKHRFSAGLITTYRGSTVPAPVLIGEVNYGIGKKFALGIAGGTTGTFSLVALKLAAGLYQRENFRLHYRMSLIYYPERKGTYLFDKSQKNIMPWMLTMGLFDAEWRTRGGLRLAAGMGFIETHCIDGMRDLLQGRKNEEGELPFEVFNTVQTSVSIPLSRKLILRPEAIMIFQGTQLVIDGAHKVRPLNIYLNLVYNF